MSSALLWFMGAVKGALVSAVVCAFAMDARERALSVAAVALVAFCGAVFFARMP